MTTNELVSKRCPRILHYLRSIFFSSHRFYNFFCSPQDLLRVFGTRVPVLVSKTYAKLVLTLFVDFLSTEPVYVKQMCEQQSNGFLTIPNYRSFMFYQLFGSDWPNIFLPTELSCLPPNIFFIPNESQLGRASGRTTQLNSVLAVP